MVPQDALIAPSHPHSHHAHPRPPRAAQRVLLPPRRRGGTWAGWLPASETPTHWRDAQGSDCGNGGVFPRRPRLPRASPPHAQQRHPVWGTWAVLCLRELWHPPLRQASRDTKDLNLGLRFQCWHKSSQPISKPPQRISQFFLPSRLPTAKKGYKPRWGSWINQWWSRSPGVSSTTTP